MIIMKFTRKKAKIHKLHQSCMWGVIECGGAWGNPAGKGGYIQ